MRTRSSIRFPTALTAVVLALIAGCAAPATAGTSSGTATAETSAETASAAPATAGTATAGTSGGSRTGSAAGPATAAGAPSNCDGVPAPASWQLLPPSATVVAAVTCSDTYKYVAGHGMWTYRQVLPLPAAEIPALVAGLTKLDKPRGDSTCTGGLIAVPSFVVTLADGTKLRPRVPDDGCHPRKEVITALNTATMAPIAESRTGQVLGDLQTTTNCGDGAKSPAIWIGTSNQRAAKGARPTLPSTGSVSICHYRPTGDQEGELTRAGTTPVQQLKTLWTKLPAGTSTACPPTPDIMNSSAVDWLMFLPTPRPPYRFNDSGASPIALLELGGCRRLFDLGTGLVQDVPAALASQLAALSDQPAH